LRHTGITEAAHAKGADVVDISRLVGHRDSKTTQGYIHVTDERLHNAVAKMPNISQVLVKV
jgi:site-specific recombinase XerD